MNDRRQFLVASVLAVQDSCFLYPSCQNCCSRLTRTSKGYVQDLFQESGEQKCSTIQGCLFQAAEYCFVGRTFVFGLKTSLNHDGRSLMSNSTLQSSYTGNGRIKYLVACQISLPNLGYVDCTVISCYKWLLEAVNLSHVSGASHPPGNALIATDLSNGELSSLCSSGSTQESVLSSSRDDLSSPWQQISFELISLSVEKATTKELSPSEATYTRDIRSQAWNEEHFSEKPGTFSINSQLTQDESRSEAKGEGETSCKFGVESVVSNVVTDRDAGSKAAEKLKNTSQLALAQPLATHGFRPVKSTLDVEDKYSEAEIAYTPTCLDKSGNPVVCMHHTNLLCSPELLCKQSRASGIYQDNHPAIWDDLPLSESLSEFIARVETNKSPVPRPGFDAFHSSAGETIDALENADSLHPYFSSPLESATRKAAKTLNFSTGCIFSLEPAKRRATESRNLLNHRSMQAEEDWNCSPTVPSAFTKDLSNSLSTSRSPPTTNNAKNGKSATAVALALKHSGYPNAERKIKPAYLSLGNIKRQKLNFSYPNAATSFSTNEDICKDLASQIKSRNLKFDLEMQQRDESLGEYESDLKTDVRAVTYRSLLQNDIQSSDDGFDASAELFDTSGKELEIEAETFHHSQVTFQEPPGTKNHASPERVLSRLNVGCNNSQSQLFLLTPNNSPSKRSSPRINSQHYIEPDEDFIPFSQSTPVARKFPKVGSLKVNESMTKKLSHNCRSSSTFLRNNLLKRLTGHCLAVSQKEAGLVKQLHFSVSSANDLFESDSEEWVPPSATKLIRSFILSKSTVPHPDIRGRWKEHNNCKMVDEDVSKNKDNGRKPSIDTYFIGNDLKPRTIQFAPALIQNTSINTDKNPDVGAWFLETVVDTHFSTEVTKWSPSSADRPFYSDVNMDNVIGEWSPDLFAEKYKDSQGRDFIQK
uniref:DNA damage-induced apoptosis suppressor protein isoform X2 n=1 Tax=Geotrypetes seraphini TaxID=260995 RepID=A0A6P8RGN6_GEOSA|nr:DNA damage-induced apoptosis suppressor protein isoform X2 [Geotrypetes seraphini]